MVTADLNTVQAAKVVDARAMACPGPLLEAKKSIGLVKVGEVLEIWSGEAAHQERPAALVREGRAGVPGRPLPPTATTGSSSAA